jgi:hypothetical protein
MKGGIINEGLSDQSYRHKLHSLIKNIYPNAEIIGHNELYPEGVERFEQEAFFELIKQASECDVIIAFLPMASMGTAIEIWEAYKKQKIILTVSPLNRNWSVKFLSSHIFSNMQSLESFLQKGYLNELLNLKSTQ